MLDDRELEAVKGVSFEVRAGEIVGIAGVDGNGQSELVDALTGLRKPATGKVIVSGTDITGQGARAAFDAGEGHIPEDRQRRGLVLDFTLAENIALHDYRNAPESKFGWLFPRRLTDAGEDAARRSSTSAAAARRRTPTRSRAEISRRS